ncbi:NGG1-interacting factor 3 [Chloroflexia bacterium SDU3-3]|nr:NGG1-interacting factor 3 [Chloroflexia bacterium SDU3-3]
MPTIQQAIDAIVESFEVEPPEHTCDTVKIGDPRQPLRGIVTTFLASRKVIQQAADLGANLIITHEPTFYNHMDKTDWLASDPVYTAKRDLLRRTQAVVWRCHDQWHAREPDGIITGVLRELGWHTYAHPERPYRCAIPPTTLGALAAHLKERLGAPMLRVIGSDAQVCQNVGLLVGAAGGEWQIRAMHVENLDTLVAGEINEWEISEYIRDARDMGLTKALVIVGHFNSEDAGMRYLAEHVRTVLPGVPVTHIPTGDPFRFI